MKIDYIIEFRRVNGTKVQLVLYPDRLKTTKGREIDTLRDVFKLEVERRKPPPATVIEIEPWMLGEWSDTDEDDGRWKINFAADKLSSWLLGQDVKENLAGVFATLPANQKIRLIFRTDESLRELFDPTQVPIELVRPHGDDTPYAITANVASVIHQIDKNVGGGLPANALDWPLRVLIVRSDPKDLGLYVPPAIPIRDEILELGAQFGPGAVVVDVISSEPGIGKPATWQAFIDQMKAYDDPYNIVIYLGHGSIKETDGSSCLRFEDGEGHHDVPHYDIIIPFHNKPVPVVMLVACQTAGSMSQPKLDDLHKNISDWLRGSRGVAQALISSLNTRTQVVIGMRYRLDATDATLFINSFFDSLLRLNVGNVEDAVHAARRELKQRSRFPAAFSSPVVFRRLDPVVSDDEPLLSFIAQKKFVPTTCQRPSGDWETPRQIFWRNFISTSWTKRDEADKKPYRLILAALEQELIRKAIANAPLILPEWIVILPEDTGTFAVWLHGSLGPGKIEKLSGQILLDRDDIVVEGTRTTEELRAKGYKAPTDIHGRVVDFTVEPTGEIEPQTLENVPLFTMTVKVGKDFLLSPVIVSQLQSVPQRVICPGTNMIIIPPR
jgi:hypothetical protein